MTASLAILALAFGPFTAMLQTPVAQANAIDPSLEGGQNVNLGTGKVSPAPQPSSNALPESLSMVIYYIGPGLAAWVASSVATFFNYIVKLTLQSNAYALDFLTLAWTLVLSLANMFFIFILVYTAFVIMLRAETVRTMQTLSWVIAIALLVNFSFFMTRVVIDSGNIVAVQFYNKIVDQNGGVSVQGNSNAQAPADITANIMKALGVEQLLGKDSFANTAVAAGTSPWGTFLVHSVIFIAAAIVLWILAMALLMAGIKFLVRTVGLWLVLIASPLAFVFKSLNNTQSFFDKWLRALIALSFYPAVFLLMFYVLNLFVQTLGAGASGTGLINNIFNSGVEGNATLITAIANVGIRMAFVVVMMYLILKVTDWIMEQSGGLANTLINRGSSALVGASIRTAGNVGALAGRNTAGRIAYNASQNGRLQNWASTSKIGNALWRSTVGLSRATYDVRNAPGSSVLKRAASKISNVDVNAGTASQKSFNTIVADKAKRIERQAADLKATEGEAWNGQQKTQNNYDSEHGRGSFAKRISELETKRKEAAQLKQSWSQAALQSSGNPALAKGYAERAKEQAKEEKRIQEQLKPLLNAGAAVAKENEKKRVAQFADRIDKRYQNAAFNPSWGAIEGAVAIRGGGKASAQEAKQAAASTASAEELHEQTKILREVAKGIGKIESHNDNVATHLGDALKEGFKHQTEHLKEHLGEKMDSVRPKTEPSHNSKPDQNTIEPNKAA